MRLLDLQIGVFPKNGFLKTESILKEIHRIKNIMKTVSVYDINLLINNLMNATTGKSIARTLIYFGGLSRFYVKFVNFRVFLVV